MVKDTRLRVLNDKDKEQPKKGRKGKENSESTGKCNSKCIVIPKRCGRVFGGVEDVDDGRRR